jgi:glycosyltransferase involved in cell wall biosynthesis
MRYSVLLPTRNRLGYLRYAVETVLRQGYADLEVVVSDNCSDDDVGGYVASLGDPRVKYVRTDRFVPVTDNWNNALDHSSGDYVVMLGDDDCVLDGYFEAMDRYLAEYDEPDVVRTRALLYAYPGVLPGHPAGMLRPFPESGMFAAPADGPAWLGRETARALVDDSLNFRMRFGYNMQFSLVSRRTVDRLRVGGRFYHSPFPDFYASNLLFLRAERVLIVPEPWVAIGITPKSYGFFHFNERQAEGIEFLRHVPDPALEARVADKVLPGLYINTGWLYAMEALRMNAAPEDDLRVAYGRYRLAQVDHVYEHPRRTRRDLAELVGGLRAWERAAFVGYRAFRRSAALVKSLLPDRLRGALIEAHGRARRAASTTSPEWNADPLGGVYANIVEVFERASPPRAAGV